MPETLVGRAESSQSRNDLFWTFRCPKTLSCRKYEGLYCKNSTIRWSGYNDAYWWERVAETKQSTTRTLPCGDTYRLNHSTGEVFLVED